MKTKWLLLVLALGISTCLLNAQGNNTPPAGGQRPGNRQVAPGGGPGGPGAPQGPGGFHVIPPPAMQQLNLTAEQRKQIEQLEADVKARMEKILTPEQMNQLKQMRPPQGGPGMRGQRGPGGPGGGPGGLGGPEGGPGEPPQQ